MRRIFNFADNRVANLTAEEQNMMHTRMHTRKSGILVSQTGDEEYSRDDKVDG